MYDYHTVYHAHNQYELTVHQAVFQLLVLPSSGGAQRLIDFHVEASVPHDWWTARNTFGAQCIIVSPRHSLAEIKIDVTCHVEQQDINPFDRPLVDPASQWARLQALDFRVEHGTYLRHTALTQCSPGDLPLPEINREAPMIDFIVDLGKTLYEQLQYDAAATDAHTPAAMAWANRRGVCQDFAHVFIGWCRVLGIPARYASGYLSQGHQYRGDGQLHAWAECYLPEDGWVGIDTSNNLLVDHHYIKIAHGRDYYDCSPMTGVLISGGKQVSLHSVSVDMQPNQ